MAADTLESHESASMTLTGSAPHKPVRNDRLAIYTHICYNPVSYAQIFDAKFYCIDGGLVW